MNKIQWEKEREGRIIANSKIKNVIYSITKMENLFYVGLTRNPNKQNKFLEDITGRLGRELQIRINGKLTCGSVIARCYSIDVAKQFVSNFEESIID